MNMASVSQTTLFREPVLNVEGNEKRDDSDAEKNSLFQTLLKNTSTEETNDWNTLELADVKDMNVDSWWHVFQQLMQVSDNKTEPSIVEDVSLDEYMDWTQGEIQAFVHQLLENNSLILDESVKDELLALLNSDETIDSSELNKVMALFLQSDEEGEMNLYQEIIGKAKDILQTIQTSDDIEKNSKALLKLLEQWSNLTQKHGTSSNSFIQSAFANSEDSDELTIWKDLVKTYQKRTQLAQNKQYHANAKVNRSDVKKWLHQLMSNSQHTGDKLVAHHSAGFQTIPMTQTEQYVIHVDEVKQPDLQGKQLINQFQKIIHSSRFVTNINGTNQFSVSLQPENLGDLTVKLTQINGELTAKILVSSHAAKEMLEANIHQLKHMFSPHQVVIERTDVSLTSQEAMNEEGEEAQSEQEEQDKSDDSSDTQNDSSDDDFGAYMEELLWNEKGQVNIDGRY